MKQITEDYVSYETAQLLKEKGFDCKCRSYYIKSEEMGIERFFCDVEDDYNHLKNYPWLVSYPSQSLALKWLREVHKLFIEIVWIGYENMYSFNVTNMKDGFIKEANIACSYNKAVEAALKYTLENLI